MRLLTSILVITAAVLGCTLEASAGLNFHLDRTFTIPGLSGTIRQMRFNDRDQDSIPEVLACDTSKAVLYSIARDSIMFTYVPDSSNFISAVEYADVDRDSIPDIVVAIVCDSGFNFDYLVIWRVISFSGVSGFETADTLVLSFWPPPPYFRTQGCCLRVLPDYYGGYDHLLFSALELQMWDWSSSWHELVTVGRSRLYWSFPDSILWEDSIQIPVTTTSVSASGRLTNIVAK